MISNRPLICPIKGCGILYCEEKVEKSLQKMVISDRFLTISVMSRRHEKARQAFIYAACGLFEMVLKRGLEPLSLSAYAPQAYVSTNFTT